VQNVLPGILTQAAKTGNGARLMAEAKSALLLGLKPRSLRRAQARCHQKDERMGEERMG